MMWGLSKSNCKNSKCKNCFMKTHWCKLSWTINKNKHLFVNHHAKCNPEIILYWIHFFLKKVWHYFWIHNCSIVWSFLTKMIISWNFNLFQSITCCCLLHLSTIQKMQKYQQIIYYNLFNILKMFFVMIYNCER